MLDTPQFVSGVLLHTRLSGVLPHAFNILVCAHASCMKYIEQNFECSLNIVSHSFVSYTPVASMWFLPKHLGEFHRLSCVRTYARICTAIFDMF